MLCILFKFSFFISSFTLSDIKNVWYFSFVKVFLRHNLKNGLRKKEKKKGKGGKERKRERKRMEPDEQKESYAAIKSLHGRCQAILADCQKRNDIEGMYRYTHSLTAEMGFLDKVTKKKKIPPFHFGIFITGTYIHI